MPKNKSNDTLLRQWAMLRMLSRRNLLTTAEITQRLASEGFHVDQRTVQRNLQELSGAFPLRCNDKSTPWGWGWIEDADLGIPGLSVPEALTLKMVEDYLAPLLPESLLAGLRPKLNEARKKLDALEENNSAARWSDKIRVVHPAMNTIAPEIRPEVMATVQESLLREKQLEVTYQSFAAQAPKIHRIHPLALVQRGPITYLVCTVFDYQDIRLYTLHRMSAATLLEEEAGRPADFDIDRYIEEGHLHFGEGGQICLKLWVNPIIAALLRESPISGDMTLREAEGGFEVTATVSNTWQLQWWLLSHCHEIEVLEPQALRESIANQLREGLSRYERG